VESTDTVNAVLDKMYRLIRNQYRTSLSVPTNGSVGRSYENAVVFNHKHNNVDIKASVWAQSSPLSGRPVVALFFETTPKHGDDKTDYVTEFILNGQKVFYGDALITSLTDKGLYLIW